MNEQQWLIFYEFMVGFQNQIIELRDLLSELVEQGKPEETPTDGERYDL